MQIAWFDSLLWDDIILWSYQGLYEVVLMLGRNILGIGRRDEARLLLVLVWAFTRSGLSRHHQSSWPNQGWRHSTVRRAALIVIVHVFSWPVVRLIHVRAEEGPWSIHRRDVLLWNENCGSSGIPAVSGQLFVAPQCKTASSNKWMYALNSFLCSQSIRVRVKQHW